MEWRIRMVITIISPLLFYIAFQMELLILYLKGVQTKPSGVRLTSTSRSRDQRQDMEVGPNLHRCILIVFVHSLFVVWFHMVIFVRWDLHRLCWWKNCLSVSPLKNSKMWLITHKSLNMNMYTFRPRFRFLSKNIILDTQCIKWTCFQPRQSIHQLLSTYKMMFLFCASILSQHMLLKMQWFYVELSFH